MKSQQQLAVSIVLSAYYLVEYVFENDKEAFLKSTESELREKTKIIKFTKERKEEFQILVFPEAYACLMPLVANSKISGGMSLMVDIGGGTTDISFFTIEDDWNNPRNNKLKVYSFNSIDKGLNYLTNSEIISRNSRSDSNIRDASELNNKAVKIYKRELNYICSCLRIRLHSEFITQGDLPEKRFKDALDNRPIIYTGGGSIFSALRSGYDGFKNIIHINHKNWKSSVIDDLPTIISLGLCPILSTAYGLSISRPNDDIICEPFRDVFRGIRQTKGKREDGLQKPHTSFGRNIGGSHGFNYMDDYDAWK